MKLQLSFENCPRAKTNSTLEIFIDSVLVNDRSLSITDEADENNLSVNEHQS